MKRRALGASGFPELKQNLLYGHEFEEEQILTALGELNRSNHALEATLRSLPGKKKDVQAKKVDLTKLVASLPQLPAADQQAQNALADRIALKKVFEERIVGLKKIQEQIAETQTRVRVFAASFEKFSKELLASAATVGIADVQPLTLSVDFAKSQVALTQRSLALQGQIDTLKSGQKTAVGALLAVQTDTWDFDNYDALAASIEKKTSETKAYETLKLRYQQQKLAISQAETLIGALEKEISRIEAEDVAARDRARSERFEKYCEWFSVLAAERTELTKLYQPLQDSLARGSETDKRLKFEASFTYDVAAHLQKGLAILDRTKRGNFRDVEVLRSALLQLWDRFSKAGFEAAAVRIALTDFWKRFTELDSDGTKIPITIESQLRDEFSLMDFTGWILNPSFFRVVSSLQFDDTGLHLLSPGQRGIVLLMLYLGLDRGDARPLIIDQPEDNLDNLSVYKDLIRLFRERKRHRQIILITHNPNLVVNTDAEQVIVAGYDGKTLPRIVYSSGSLENQAEQIPNVTVDNLADGIIEKVCHVLEGGPGAFSRRSKVYSLSPKIG